MAATLDHLILRVNDAQATALFFAKVLGFADEGQEGPFTVLRVSPDLTLQLAPWGTAGNEHLAFALDGPTFDAAFARLREAAIPHGDSFHDSANMRGPGDEPAARGRGRTLYFLDPNRHLIEIRTYD